MSMLYIMISILGITFLIFIHELGHFLAAKRAGIDVDEFSIGFGKKLFGFKRAETEYSLRLILLGGYVKIAGLETEAKDPARSFENKPKFVKLQIYLAGVIFNIIFALIVLTFANMAERKALGTSVNPIDGTPAAEVLAKGDRITAVNGTQVSTWDDISREIRKSQGGSKISLTIQRDGLPKDVTINPVKKEAEDEFGGKVERMMIGVAPAGEVITLPGMQTGEAFIGSLKATGMVYSMTYIAIAKLFTGNAQAKKTLGGPVLIVASMSQAAGYGLLAFFQFLAVISLALAVMNSMPIPVLDGGHVMFLGLETLRGKPLSGGTMTVITNVFFALLITLGVYVMFLDVVRISG